MNHSGGSHVFLTGATGLIGRHLLRRLLDADPARTVSILSRRPCAIPCDRVAVLRGDLAQPRFGLNPADWDALRRSVTGIIHCGADVRFGLPLEESRAVNVGGAATAIELARGCSRLRQFAHISTVYVAGSAAVELPEAPYDNVHGFFNTYEQSKYEAEKLVQAEPALPAAIWRLSNVVGDSRTGHVEQYNHVHQLLRLAPHAPLPILPATPEARIDVIATDWAVAAIAILFDRRFRAGEIRNLCAGYERSLSVAEMTRVTFDGLTSRAPKLVSPERFRLFAKSAEALGNARIRALLEQLSLFVPHLSVRQEFRNDSTLELLRSEGMPDPDSADLFRRVVLHCRQAA